MRLLGMDSMRAWWWDVQPGTGNGEHGALRDRYVAALSERLDAILGESGASHLVVEGTGDPAWGRTIWTNGALTIIETATDH